MQVSGLRRSTMRTLSPRLKQLLPVPLVLTRQATPLSTNHRVAKASRSSAEWSTAVVTCHSLAQLLSRSASTLARPVLSVLMCRKLQGSLILVRLLIDTNSYVNGACYLKRSKPSLIEAGHVWTAELIDLTASASTSSTIPTNSAAAGKDLTCTDGKDDKQSYVATNGGTFIVECGVDYGGNDLEAVDSTSFAASMDTCDDTEGCVDVSYVWGRCYMKSTATFSSAAGHVWTGRRTSAGPSDAEVLSALSKDGGSFCTSYIDYKAPVTTKITTTTLGASTVLSIQTEKVTTTKLNTAYATSIAVQTLPMLQPRQADPTPSILSRWPASHISSICSLVATGTSTTLSTATATVAPVAQISTFTTLIPVTKTTLVTTVISSTTRA